MLTEIVLPPHKVRGRRRLLSPDHESELAHLYFLENETAADLADEYAQFSRTGSLTPTGVREIAIRWVMEGAPAADNRTGQCANAKARKKHTRDLIKRGVLA